MNEKHSILISYYLNANSIILINDVAPKDKYAKIIVYVKGKGTSPNPPIKHEQPGHSPGSKIMFNLKFN